MAAKKKGPGKIAGKQIRKQVRSLKGDVQDIKKGAAKEASKATRRMASQNKTIKAEFAKLSTEMKSLQSKKAPKRELSMYNLFVRKQIQQGKTFEEAVNSWKSSRKIIENPDLAKAKAKTKTRTVTKTKIVVRKVPKIVIRKVKVPARAPAPAANPELKSILKELSALKTEVNSLEKEAPAMKPRMKALPAMGGEENLSHEEVAVRLTRLYFEEIARLGFKRRLDFDAIINAYYYCLQRLQNKDKELEVMRKIVEREEAKISGEPKSSLFPSMQE